MKLRTKLNNGLPDIVTDLTPLEDKIKADAIVPTKVEYGAGLDGLPEIGKNKVKITLSNGTELVSDEVLDIFPAQLTLSKDGKTLTILLSDGTTIDENVGVLLDNLYNADGDIIEPRTVEMTNLLTWVGQGGMDMDTPVTFKNKVLDYTGTECTIGQKLIGAINGMVQWIDDDGINYADLGTGIDVGTLESNKINPTRWDNTINAGDLPTNGKVPDGKNRVSSYNGGWRATITLPTVPNYIGEVFILKNTATNTVEVTKDNTNLLHSTTVPASNGVLTAIWNGKVWDVVTNPNEAFATCNPDTQETSGSAFSAVKLSNFPYPFVNMALDDGATVWRALVAGTYRVTSSLRIKKGNANQNAFRITKNGAVVNGTTCLKPTSSTYNDFSRSILVKLEVGDKVGVEFKGTLSTNVYNNINVAKIASA